MLIESRPADDAELAALLTAQQRELRDAGREFAAYSLHDDTSYLVGIKDWRVMACAGWRPIGARTAELTRMYVRPAYRNRGYGRQLIVALEEEALADGRPVLRLETGTYLPAAMALYRSAGYATIPAYGEYVGNPLSVCFEKSLVVTSG
jgi:putative acetyltransferase